MGVEKGAQVCSHTNYLGSKSSEQTKDVTQ